MLYYLLVFIVAIGLMVFKARNNESGKYIICIMVSYTVALAAMVLYLAKDSYYYNSINRLFSIPLAVWKYMMLLPANQDWVIRVLNAASLLVVFFAVCFILSFGHMVPKKAAARIRLACGLLVLVQLALYDPLVYEWAYRALYPRVMTSAAFEALKNGIHTATTFANMAVVLVCILFIPVIYRRTTPLRYVRIHMIGIGGAFALVMLSYLFFLGGYPTFLLNVSQVAGIKNYLSMPLNTNAYVHRIFPYYIIINIGLICLFVVRMETIRQRMAKTDFSLAKEISASDTTSKIFCHYMKNEVLAIQSELEGMTAGESSPEQTAEIISRRCDHLYERLDEVQRVTRSEKLLLTENRIDYVLEEVLAGYEAELEAYTVKVQLPEEITHTVLLDNLYFEQALCNILSNAIDAMADLPPARKNLTMQLKFLDNWMMLEIRDTGVGIPKEDMDRIFTPFFSTGPVRKHWGMGLPLTYKVIQAHEGKIEVESQPDVGTTVRILLPALSSSKRELAAEA